MTSESRWSEEFVITPTKKKEKKRTKAVQTQAYEWPEATRKYRLMIEGLDDDLIRYKSEIPNAGGDADQNIRRRERRTPAQDIEAAVADALEKVLEESIKGFANKKSFFANEVAIRRVLSRLLGPKKRLVNQLIESMRKASEGGGRAGVERMNELLLRHGVRNIRVPDVTKVLAESIKERASFIANSVIDETVMRFADRVEVGKSVEEIADDLMEAGETSRSRARVIARTESAVSYHEGQIAAWKEVGFVERKHFMMAGGACQYCQAVENKYGEGNESVPIDEPIVKAGSTIVGTKGGTMQVGRDMQGTVHPNCRCDFIAVDPD